MIRSVVQEADYAVLTAVTLALFGLLHRRLWRGCSGSAVSRIAWLLAIGVLVGGWFLVGRSAHRERERMQQMVEGFAPTYAQELSLMGHEQITLQTSPDDRSYWRMIVAQKRWLAVNRSINDISTLRKLPDGRIARIVDAETDFNRNGAFDEAREQRTAIGAIYEGALLPAMAKALAGESVFVKEPWSDRWGTWVSAVVPMRNFRGDVEAALAVDFDAAPLVAAIRRARLAAIGAIAASLLLLAGGSALLAQQRAPRDFQAEPAGGKDAIAEKQKLETLVNSIDGIVWEADARTFRFNYVSSQSERLLGYTPEQWMADVNFWRDKLHPEDRWAYDHCAQMIAGKVPYSYEYRMIAADGRTVWINESAAMLLDAAGEPVLVRGVFHDITAKKRAAEELEHANAALIDSSRHAGMAEVATGVLHNVGNVLNSVNVSGNVISERLRRSKVIELGKVAGLLTLQKADFIGFVTTDPRGPHIPELISRVAEALREEHRDLIEEVESITRNIGHIKEIVAMQQGFAKGAGHVETLAIQSLVDDAIKINAMQLSRHHVAVLQAYEVVPQVQADKHLVLQILVNLLRNAQQAIQESGREERRIVVRIQGNGGETVRVIVQDTGGGIAPENLTRIFSHGFTTKKTGHGFGLHSSALAATGMGGALSAHSDGPGTGATFTLELPVFNATPAAAAA